MPTSDGSQRVRVQGFLEGTKGSRTNQFERTTLYHERTDLIPHFSSLTFVSFSETRLPDPPSSRWRTDSRVTVRSLTVFSGEDLRTKTPREPAGQQLPDSEHEALLSWRNLVNVVRLHHCTIVIRLRMKTREEPSLTQLRAMIHRYRKRDWTNKQTNDSNDSYWRTDRP